MSEIIEKRKTSEIKNLLVISSLESLHSKYEIDSDLYINVPHFFSEENFKETKNFIISNKPARDFGYGGFISLMAKNKEELLQEMENYKILQEII